MTERLSEVFDTVYPADLSPDVVALWREAANGWQPPTDISEAEYQRMKSDPVPSAYRGFIGFGCSYGGKWFGGYARGGYNADGTPRNHQAESARAVTRVGAAIANATLNGTRVQERGYDATPLVPGTAIYCDPPYRTTEGYKAVEDFDSDAFWEWIRKASEEGVDVFVSEYSAPEDFERVWQSGKLKTLATTDQGREVALEGLWMYAGGDREREGTK